MGKGIIQGVVNPDILLAIVPDALGDEMPDEKGYVAHAIPQRRNIQFENAQPVVQILAELALPDHLRQISVGRADKPKVGMELTLMSYLLDFPGFKDTEKLRLHGQRQFTDFIQKNGARVRHFKLALHAADLGSRERPSLITEQFRFHQFRRQCGTVHSDERPIRALAGHMQSLRHQLLPCARFPAYENRFLAERETPPQAAHVFNARGFAHNSFERI